jgi:hypothetical protein
MVEGTLALFEPAPDFLDPLAAFAAREPVRSVLSSVKAIGMDMHGAPFRWDQQLVCPIASGAEIGFE